MKRTRANHNHRRAKACFKLALPNQDRDYTVAISMGALKKRRTPDHGIKITLDARPGRPEAEFFLNRDQVDQCIHAIMAKERAKEETANDPVVAIQWGLVAVNLSTDLFTNNLFMVNGRFV